jgi:hypothetical protein
MFHYSSCISSDSKTIYLGAKIPKKSHLHKKDAVLIMRKDIMQRAAPIRAAR